LAHPTAVEHGTALSIPRVTMETRRQKMTADYNGWADRPEDEREAEEAAEAEQVPLSSHGAHEVALTRDQTALVRTTWQQVVPIADTAARLFYNRLFELEPDLRSLFGRTDMAEQRRKLMQTLALAVASLDRLETLRPALETLGRRHVSYGVEDRHYDLVGLALLWTLEQGLGDEYTGSVRHAWTAAYTTLSTIMQNASATGREAA
jgi:hemoglobin-like flavoprotein